MLRNAFIIIALVICSLPASLMPLVGKSPLGANESPVREPRLMIGDAINRNVLSDFSAYIEKHFAYRQELITCHSAIISKVFKVSPVKDVILGKDGWLFYAKTLDDIEFTDNTLKILFRKFEESQQRIDREALLDHFIEIEQQFSKNLTKILESSGSFSAQKNPALKDKISIISKASLERLEAAETLGNAMVNNPEEPVVSTDEYNELLRDF